MKTAIFALMLSASALACPQLQGEYTCVSPFDGESVVLEILQNGSSVAIEMNNETGLFEIGVPQVHSEGLAAGSRVEELAYCSSDALKIRTSAYDGTELVLAMEMSFKKNGDGVSFNLDSVPTSGQGVNANCTKN